MAPALAPAPLLPPDLVRRLDRLALLLRRPQRGRLQGARPSPRRGRGVEFADFRPYTWGDDRRQIDWKAYARLERFFLRLFAVEEDLLLHLLVDQSLSMGFGEPSKLDFARRLAAALGYLALGAQEWAVVAPLSEVAPRAARPAPVRAAMRGRSALPRLLGQLAALEPAGGTDLSAGVRRHLAAHRRPGPLVLISDLLDPAWEPALRRVLAAGCELRLIHALAPEEADPQLEGDWRMVDAETGEAVEVSADEDLLARYRERLAAWQAELAAWCGRHRATYVPVRSDFPLDGFVTDTLRRAGVVG